MTDEHLTFQILNVIHRVLRHNVRTSLQVIDSYAELMQNETERTGHRAALQTIRDHATSLQHSSEQLTTIQQVLNTQKTEPQPVPAVVDGCLGKFQTDYPDAEIELTITVDDSRTIENPKYCSLHLLRRSKMRSNTPINSGLSSR